MKKNKSLIEMEKNKSTFKRFIHNTLELIKSRIDKNYTLSADSPDFLKQNKKLIIRTIKKDNSYLDQVPIDLIFEELKQDTLPNDGIINTAFTKGYEFSESSPYCLLIKYAKTAILYYIDNFSTNIIEHLYEEVFLHTDLRDQIVDLAIKKGYNISRYSPSHLKEISKFVTNYYDNLPKDELKSNPLEYIAGPKLVTDISFLQDYINILKNKGLDNNTILETLTANQNCRDAMKGNIQLFELVFNKLTPSNLNEFFTTIFSREELKDFFEHNKKMHGKLLKLSELYQKDDTILLSLNSELLNEQYQNIPNFKLPIIAKNPEFQKELLGLSHFEYILYSKMSQHLLVETNRWNRFELNIVENLSDGFFGELINDLCEQAKNGNLISPKEIETLTFLFSQELRVPKSYFEGNHIDSEYNNNVLNITNKKELDYFEEIKELVCDTVLANPDLNDTELTSPIKKYLKNFINLPPIDRMKLALLQKYYNISLFEADKIVKMFSTDIDNIPSNNEYQNSIIEQIKAIRNIFQCGDINTLRQVSDLGLLVETNLSVSTYLIEQAQEMIEQLYKKNLYMPKDSNMIGSVTYNGKNINIYDGGTDFSMIVKRLHNLNENTQQIWNLLTNDQGDLRFYTCTSYMTGETLLDVDGPEVILGFAQSLGNHSFDGIFTSDAGTPYRGGDDIYNNLSSKILLNYISPSKLETLTEGHHNEIVINKLDVEGGGIIQKLQPDYIVYIKKNNQVDLESDELWKKTLKTASEFGVPIVVIDREKVRESERAKISKMSEELNENSSSNDILKYLQKINHYTARYNSEDISQYVAKENLVFWNEQLEHKKSEEKSGILAPDIHLPISSKNQSQNKHNILNRQAQLKQYHILQGEEER